MKKLLVFTAVLSLVSAVLYAEDEAQLSIPEPAATAAATAVVKPVVSDTDSNAGWQAFRLTLDLDFTTVAMKQANDEMNSGYDVSGFGGGFMGTVDLGVAVYPFLLLGTRVGYLYCLPATYKLNALATDPDPTLKTETSRDASLIPVELGARLRFGIPGTTFAISTGAFAGVCFAHVANNADVINEDNKPDSYVQKFDGFGFACEWTVAAEMKLMKGVDVNLHGGYRMAGAANVTQSEDAFYTFDSGTTITEVGNKGDKLKNASGVDVPFDYAGLNVGVGISLGF